MAQIYVKLIKYKGFDLDLFLEKHGLNVEEFNVKTNTVWLKILFFTMKHGKVGYFHVTD